MEMFPQAIFASLYAIGSGATGPREIPLLETSKQRGMVCA